MPAFRFPDRCALAAVAFAAVASATPVAQAAESAGAAEATQQVIFVGMFVVTNASKTCEGLINNTRQMYFSTLVYGNNRAAILLQDPYETVEIAPTKTANFGKSGSYEATKIDRWNGISKWTAKYDKFNFSPAKITDKTQSLTITGQLTQLNNDKTCTATFRAVGVRN